LTNNYVGFLDLGEDNEHGEFFNNALAEIFSYSQKKNNAREMLPRNTLPQTPQCVGAFSTRYALFLVRRKIEI
jgi:hypothetical protein